MVGRVVGGGVGGFVGGGVGGLAVGALDGAVDGPCDGRDVGDADGAADGAVVGAVGAADGGSVQTLTLWGVPLSSSPAWQHPGNLVRIFCIEPTDRMCHRIRKSRCVQARMRTGNDSVPRRDLNMRISIRLRAAVSTRQHRKRDR